MRLHVSLSAAVALCLAAWLAAAPSGSPVADASMRADHEAVRALLRQGADVSAAQGDGMTALHWAAERGDAELAAILLYAGANVGAVTRIGEYTPLHLASRTGSAAVVRALLEGRRQRLRAHLHDRRDAAAPGRRGRERGSGDKPARGGRRCQRERIRRGDRRR